MTAHAQVTSWGILLPESVLQSHLFGVLTAFVALNTVMYVALAVAKILPKIYVSDWVSRSNTRSQTRSIYPDDDPGCEARWAGSRRGPRVRVRCDPVRRRGNLLVAGAAAGNVAGRACPAPDVTGPRRCHRDAA